jgi:thiol-disulfide isomerase/thioredoxin
MSEKRARKKTRTQQDKTTQRVGLVMIGGVVLLIIALMYIVAQPATTSGVGLGDYAPNFSLPVVTAQGLGTQKIQLSSLQGKVVVLEFMASWCKFCQAMAPAVETLYEQYQNKGVIFLSVATTLQNATAESTAQFMRDYGVHWTHVLDTDNSVFQRYGIQATPTYFVLDRSGKVQSAFHGIVTTDAFVTAIDTALSS